MAASGKRPAIVNCLALMKGLLFFILICLFSVLAACQTFTLQDNPSSQENVTIDEIAEDDGTLLDARYKGLLAGNVYSMAFDHKDILWIGDGNKVAAFKDGSFRFFDILSDNLPSASVTKVYVDKENKKWFGTSAGYVYTYDNKEWTLLPNPGLGGVNDIIQDKTGDIWVLGSSGIWSYQDNEVYEPFEFKDKGYDALAIADNGDIIIAGMGTRNLLRYTGQAIEVLSSQFHNSLYILQMSYDGVNNRVYFELGNFGGYDEGIYTYENGALVELPYKLVRTKYEGGWNVTMHVDEKGTLWAIYYASAYELGIARLNGDTWEAFEPASPLPGLRINDIAVGSDGSIWIAGSYGYTPSGVFDAGRSGPLARYDGSTWTVYPYLPRDPRYWWNYKDLSELINEPLVADNITDILANPAAYYGKKIRIIGSLKQNKVTDDWLLPPTIADVNGNNLRIEPSNHPELDFLLEDTGIMDGMSPKDNREFIGYLEYWSGETFSPWLHVTEIYPLTDDAEQRSAWVRQYKDYLALHEADTTVIRRLIEDWRMERSAAETSKEPSTTSAQTRESIRDEWEQQPLGDIHYEYVQVFYKDNTAKAYVYGLTIDPVGAYFQSEAFTSQYRIAIRPYFELSKEGDSWRITEDILYLTPYAVATIPGYPSESPFSEGPIAVPSDNSIYLPEETPGGFPPVIISPMPVAISGETIGSGKWMTFSRASGDLAADNVNSIVEDRDGNIWIAGFGGVSCYDGSMWRIYTTADGLARDDVHNLFVDNNGYIWAATGEGLNRFDGEKWITYLSGYGGRSDQYTAVFIDSRGNLWGGTLAGINLFNGEKWQNFPSGDESSVITVKTIYEDKQGRVYFLQSNYEVKVYDNGNWSTLEKVEAMARDNAGVLWCQSGENMRSGVLYYLDDGGDWRQCLDIAMPEMQFWSIYWDRQGYFWVTCNDQVRCYSGKTYQTFTNRSGLAIVETMFQDSRGDYWFGAINAGLSRFSPDILN